MSLLFAEPEPQSLLFILYKQRNGDIHFFSTFSIVNVLQNIFFYLRNLHLSKKK